MKRMLRVLCAAVFAAAVAASAADAAKASDAAKQSSLASARAKITETISNPSQMTAIMKTLSAEDQVSFLSEVNAAIAKMPGEATDRAAKFVAVANAALAGAQKGNAMALVAEIYASVPVYALPAVSENLASGLMNRAAATFIATKICLVVNKCAVFYHG